MDGLIKGKGERRGGGGSTDQRKGRDGRDKSIKSSQERVSEDESDEWGWLKTKSPVG